MIQIDGKRCVLASLGIIAATVTTIMLKGDVTQYYILIGTLAGGAAGMQTITDVMGK